MTWKWAAAAWSVPIYTLTEVKAIYFDDGFNDSIDDVEWPSGVRTIRFGKRFNQDIKQVRWPDSVDSLDFG